VTLDGEETQATTHQATHIDAGLPPYHWYKNLVLAGAREHSLPHDFVRSIARVCSIEDSNAVRRRKNEAMLNQKD